MDTKRCVYCQKLARADAEVCSRCGHSFERTRITRDASRRSIPPASPHHAGHYSGLHPEDQPYQSTMISIVRSGERSHPQQTQREPEGIILPLVDVPPIVPDPPVPPVASVTWQEAQEVEWSPVMPVTPLSPLSSTPLARNTPIPDIYDEDLTEREQQLSAGRPVALYTARLHTPLPPHLASKPPYMPARSPFQSRPILTVLTISLLLLLVATGLLAYMFISRKPEPSFATATLSAVPNKLRVNDQLLLTGKGFGANDPMSFTRDNNELILDGSGKQVHTDVLGAFSVRIFVGDWGTGDHIIHAIDEAQHFSDSVTITIEAAPAAPPSLQLAVTRLDFGAAGPGVVSSKTVTLTNAGGGSLNWQASSDQPWLSLAPGGGTFNGSMVALVTVNRGALAPQAYTGHIKFTQQGSSAQPLTLTVTMAVNAAPASLSIAPVALSYSGSTTQNPASQTITLQNSGKRPLNWSATTATGNGVSWLSLAPANGQLAPGASTTITVGAQSQLLAVGSYQGTIIFKGGSNPQVSVSLNVAAPGSLVVSPPSLSFAAYSGHSPASQSVTLQNSGGEPVGWTAVAATTNGAGWLSISPTGGQLGPGSKATVTMSVNGASLQSNAYQGTVTFNYGGQSSQVAVALTMSTPPTPAINVQVHALNFTTIMGKDPDPQTFTFSNSGNATLNWSASEDQTAATYAPLTPPGGSLAPGQSATITVSPTTTQLGAGTQTGTITIADSDAGTSVPPQKVVVSITVLDQAQISVSPGSLDFNNDSALQVGSQLLSITNTGSSDLNWAITIPSQSAAWLSVDKSSGTLSPGASVAIYVTCDSSQLTPGASYEASLEVSDSDAGTPVTPQTVDVMLTVS